VFCQLHKNDGPMQDGVPELYLEPRSECDRHWMEWLLENQPVRGFGRDPVTNKILHVRIALERKEPHE